MRELLGENPAEGRAEDVCLFVLERVEQQLERAGQAGHAPRPAVPGRAPVPGASTAIVCTPCGFSASSNGAERPRLAPMPVSSSSGRRAPRIDVRSLTPSTSRIETPPWPLRGFPGQAPAQVTSQPMISACMVCPGSVKDLEVAHVAGNALFEPDAMVDLYLVTGDPDSAGRPVSGRAAQRALPSR